MTILLSILLCLVSNLRHLHAAVDCSIFYVIPAQQTCADVHINDPCIGHANGGRIATINSAEENACAVALCEAGGDLYDCWIGLRISQAGLVWADGTTVTYGATTTPDAGTPWDAGEPTADDLAARAAGEAELRCVKIDVDNPTDAALRTEGWGVRTNPDKDQSILCRKLGEDSPTASPIAPTVPTAAVTPAPVAPTTPTVAVTPAPIAPTVPTAAVTPAPVTPTVAGGTIPTVAGGGTTPTVTGGGVVPTTAGGGGAGGGGAGGGGSGSGSGSGSSSEESFFGALFSKEKGDDVEGVNGDDEKSYNLELTLSDTALMNLWVFAAAFILFNGVLYFCVYKKKGAKKEVTFNGGSEV